MGLSIVYGIVKQTGGAILVESAPGQGATFRVLLPTTTRRPHYLSISHPAVAPSRPSETVLLVEDDSVVRGLARRALQTAGYAIPEAAGAGEALRIAARHPNTIHLVLSDVVMPEMSGPVLVDRLTAQRPDTRVLFMSGYTDDALAMHRLTEKGVAFLAKPFTPAVLTRRVREVLDGCETALPLAT